MHQEYSLSAPTVSDIYILKSTNQQSILLD
jgi:hypothetical protein